VHVLVLSQDLLQIGLQLLNAIDESRLLLQQHLVGLVVLLQLGGQLPELLHHETQDGRDTLRVRREEEINDVDELVAVEVIIWLLLGSVFEFLGYGCGVPQKGCLPTRTVDPPSPRSGPQVDGLVSRLDS
jgi:hypothetical protein